MLITGTNHTLKYGGITIACREWKHLPSIKKMLMKYNNYWAESFVDKCDINKLTTGEFGRANSVTTDSMSEKM